MVSTAAAQVGWQASIRETEKWEEWEESVACVSGAVRGPSVLEGRQREEQNGEGRGEVDRKR